jgi:protein-tyrosine phosphatase
MHRLDPHHLWLGHAGDLAGVGSILDAGICAVVDLALNEPAPHLPRDMVYCRFPLVDGTGNDPWILLSAIRTVASLLTLGVPTLVCCSAGSSRGPAVVAAALSTVTRRTPEDCLRQVSKSVSHDVSPGFWNEVVGVCHSLQNQPPAD